jgi:hypothetical protein
MKNSLDMFRYELWSLPSNVLSKNPIPVIASGKRLSDIIAVGEVLIDLLAKKC